MEPLLQLVMHGIMQMLSIVERSHSMSTIELYNGATTNSKGTFSIWTFVRNSPTDKDSPLMESIKDPKSKVTEPGGIIESVPSSKGIKGKIPGSWTKRRIECEDGVYLKFLMRKAHSGRSFGGKPIQSLSALWIKSRATAPLREIRVELPTDHFSTMSVLYITGRFDIVEPKEIHDLKLHMSGQQNDWMLCNPENYADYVSERVIEAEIAPKARVVQKQEGKKVIARPMRSRRIRPVGKD